MAQTKDKPDMDWHHINPEGVGGLLVLATKDEILQYRALSPHLCKHEESELRDYNTSNGGWQRKPQCLKCGSSAGTSIKRDKDLDVPLWDAKLKSRWVSSRNAKREEIESLLIERTSQLKTGGYAEYEDYLLTDEWRKKRALVLKRDGNVCQGCLSAPANEVHHLTYENIFQEFLFELISLCRDCHKMLHNKRKIAGEITKSHGEQ